MKKFLLIAASAAVLLTGCQKNESVSPNDGGQEISFQSYTGRELTKDTNPLGSNVSFNVAAYKKASAESSTDESYYTSLEYTWDSTNDYFSSSTARYWPATGVLDFYATMPSTVTAGKTVTFSSLDGATDFSAATLTNQTSTSNPKFTFRHKLTKVAFKAIGADPRLKYEITGITLNAKKS